MNDEIKEILEQLKDSIEYPKIDMPTFDGTDYEYIDNDTFLEPEKCKLLLDYITNLKLRLEKGIELVKEYRKENKELTEENERLNTELNAYKDEFCKDTIKEYELVMEQEYYKSRCEKAIDFVKKESKKCYSNQITDNPTKVIGNFMWHTDKLLNILNGGDEE